MLVLLLAQQRSVIVLQMTYYDICRLTAVRPVCAQLQLE
jgi:hypothetical protein